MVPSWRLLMWIAIFGIPVCTMAGVWNHGLVPLLILGGIGVWVVVLDAVRAQGQLDDLKIVTPQVVRLTSGRAGKFDVEIASEKLRGREIRIGFDFPEIIRSSEETVLVRLPADASRSHMPWCCVAQTRGRYTIRGCYSETQSPLQLWDARRRIPVALELRVYPDLARERKQLASLFLNRNTAGLHAQRQVGKGREFEKLREYLPGDSFDEIHWKTTAKRRYPVTKVYQIERTREVYVVVDASRLSARSSPHKEAGVSESFQRSALDDYLAAALILAATAERQNDLFGLLTFSDRVHTFLRARHGSAHYSACRDALYTLQPQRVAPDFDELCTFIRLRLRRRAMLIFLTFLDDPVIAESFVRDIQLLKRNHLVVVACVRNPNARPLFTDAGIDSSDDVYRSLAGHIVWREYVELDRILRRQGIQFFPADEDRLTVQLVAKYLNLRQRQML